MVQLFLSEPDWDDNGDAESVKKMMSLLNELESVLWSLMTSGGRSEARLWLCNAVSGITSITSHQQRELFVNLLRSKPTKLGLASQLLRMIFEKRPQKVGPIIAKKSYMLDKFFEGSPTRIFQWFSNFADGGGVEHKKGARALAKFAFANRDICWDELEWKGKHGQSPAMVATKPHYFLDLDVEQTVKNFIENVPEFWSSSEFSDSLRDGEISFVDKKFFVEIFVNLMYKEDSKDVWEVIYEFLTKESFSFLCHHLLITLEEQDFCFFLELLSKSLNTRIEAESLGSSSYWLEIILQKFRSVKSVDQLLLLNAIVNQGRQLLRLVRDEESCDEQATVKGISSQLQVTLSSTKNLAPVLKECFNLRATEAIKVVGLLSWFIHYTLSEKCPTPESWESLFKSNEIIFRRYDEYALLNCEKLSEDSDHELNSNSSRRRRRKKDRSRKRRRNFEDDGCYHSELLDFDTSRDIQDLKSRSGSWLLSTDGFSASWTNADLPEHLSKHCFSKWMKLVFTKRK
ncbi:hypothetical protein HS088_TW22G00184 [Tripterygium wilfordii]|uniref:Uncharacterized protein n=1 Tax=Tripterygium wilfordii TaxID=458696 RepID=A0A7J7BY83_TRIWF|nr:uncharacterized protein LOC119991320 [Tripterygium wilfordii]KAF5726506.1 hypothetical protein HS088_TW22G00184 [Tripterygium wilfordii]